MNKFSLENRASPEPTGAAGDIPYAVDGTTVGWVPHATGTQYLQQTDAAPPVWVNGGGGGGSVTSVAQTAPADLLSVSGSPVTGAGTLALAKVAVAKNKFYGGPAAGADADPTFRLLDADDLDPWVEKFIVERPAGLVDGYNRSFTLSQTPMHERIGVAVDGVVLRGGTDYGWTGTTFKLALNANKPRYEIRVWYSYKAKLGTALPSIELLPPDYLTANTWTDAPISNQAWSGVAYSPDLRLFAAVSNGTTNAIATTDDGASWTDQTTPTSPISGGWRSICWGNGRFVATNYTSSQFNITTLVSADGVTWTQHQTGVTAGQGYNWQGITWVEAWGLFVIFQATNTGVDSHVATSPDGETWTMRTTPSGTAGYYHTGAYSPSQHVMLAGGTSPGGFLDCMMSSDGVNWTATTPPIVPPTTASMFSLIWVEELGLWITAGTFNDGVDIAYVATTPDGVTWTLQTDSVPVGGLGSYGGGSIVWSTTRQLLVMGGVDTVVDCIMTSPDAVNYTRASAPISHGVSELNSLAVAEDTDIIVSVNTSKAMRSLS